VERLIRPGFEKGTPESEVVVLSTTPQGSFNAQGATGGLVRLRLHERRFASFCWLRRTLLSFILCRLTSTLRTLELYIGLNYLSYPVYIGFTYYIILL
jgi:hypothetical protein